MKKKTKLKLGFAFAMITSIVISSLLSILFSMHYMTHLYSLQITDARTFMNVSKRIDLLEAEIKARHTKKPIKPVVL